MVTQIMVMVMMMVGKVEAMLEELMVGRHLYNCHTVNGHLLPRRTDLRIRAN